jgi:hypothetical protein
MIRAFRPIILFTCVWAHISATLIEDFGFAVLLFTNNFCFPLGAYAQRMTLRTYI